MVKEWVSKTIQDTTSEFTQVQVYIFDIQEQVLEQYLIIIKVICIIITIGSTSG